MTELRAWGTNGYMMQAADEIERLRAERDEARRMYCVMRDGEDNLTCKEWAERKNWDCFKDNPTGNA